MTVIVKYCNRLFCCNQTCYCVCMVSATSVSVIKVHQKVDPLCTTEVDFTKLGDALHIHAITKVLREI